MSCGACWNPQIFVCFCPWCRGPGGIRRHMTETPDVFTPSQFDQASPSPDFVALLEDINTTQPARTSVQCLSIVIALCAVAAAQCVDRIRGTPCLQSLWGSNR